MLEVEKIISLNNRVRRFSTTKQAITLIAVTVLLCVADLLTPRYISFTGYYLIPIFLSIWLFSNLHVFAFVFISSLCTRMYVAINALPEGLDLWYRAINYCSIFTTFVLFYVVSSNMKRYFSKLEEYANKDALTGLLNRRHFLELAEYELRKKRRRRSSLTVVMMDIDFFKQLNDARGHDVGDKLLVDVSNCLVNTLRNIDIIGRIGGDEFALLLPDTSYEETQLVLGRLHSKLKKVFRAYGCDRLDCSIGAVNLKSDSTEDIGELLKKADTLMYQVKNKSKGEYLLDVI